MSWDAIVVCGLLLADSVSVQRVMRPHINAVMPCNVANFRTQPAEQPLHCPVRDSYVCNYISTFLVVEREDAPGRWVQIVDSSGWRHSTGIPGLNY